MAVKAGCWERVRKKVALNCGTEDVGQGYRGLQPVDCSPGPNNG